MLGSLSLAAALLLAGAGAAKLGSPQPAVAMLRRGLPTGLRFLARALLVRAAGLGELAVGSAVVLTGSRLALVLLALAYLVFLALALRLTAAWSPTSCGCFGRTDSPVGAGHVLLDALAAAAATGAAVQPPGPLGGWAGHAALPAAVGVAQAGLLAAVAYLAITARPALLAERRRVSR